MTDARDAALRQNFHWFQSVVDGLMEGHAGKYALLRSQSLVEIFDRPIQALEAGCARFEDGLFSVQRVNNRPLDLGFISCGFGERPTDGGQASR